MAQHLVFANCIPLILKFFNQNIMSYITAKNRSFRGLFTYLKVLVLWLILCSKCFFSISISVLDFPHCVVHELPELTAESLVSFFNFFIFSFYLWFYLVFDIFFDSEWSLCCRKLETTLSSAGGICSLVSTCWGSWTNWPSGSTPGQWWESLTSTLNRTPARMCL